MSAAPLPPASAETWNTTPNRTVEAAGTRFAYRRLGSGDGLPLVMLNHWGATLDNFDPRILDGLATNRTVFALDYRGVGASGGEAPVTVAEMATDMLAVVSALGLTRIDLMGFSLGGFVAQDMLRQAPNLARKVVLTGTGPAGGKGINKVGAVSTPLIIKGMLTLKDPKTYLFFTSSQAGRRAAKAFLERLKERRSDRDKPITVAAFRRQLKAIESWGNLAPQDLGAVRQPVLVANGDHDIMVPSGNSTEMAHRLPNADLVLYPDAGHGGIFQYHEAFVPMTLKFLDN
ncbi:alpha/beta fold hydrolase [Brevundimonas mediterranea]|uniref:Pimeloyl-ACP methyl ester carboxylesterase n=1 Tax=Brevundimonas mediterranea TaxID=74329 RepID=A0A7W6A339_9CAUL|nr:alpha/beta hydrolase [Brevundimonas mediterranea]MBB3870817.1 pimeloyl-ACP methyl ester carboxylesterase [Brevundimonas mediterranea]